MNLPSLLIDAVPPVLIREEYMDEIEDAYGAPSKVMRQVFRAARGVEGQSMIHVRANDPWLKPALDAVIHQASLYRLGLAIRVPVIDKTPAKLRQFADFYRMVRSNPNRVRVTIIPESAYSKDVDGVKGEHETERAQWVVDALLNAVNVLGYDDVSFALGSSDLPQSTKEKHSNYEWGADWALVSNRCFQRDVPLSGIIQAYSLKRMVPGAANIVEAEKVCASLGLYLGIIPINEAETLPDFTQDRISQATQILKAVPTLRLLGLTTWNREVFGSIDDYFTHCGDVIRGIRTA